jgi:hypothetical protein
VLRYPSDEVDELERVRDRLFGKALREYRSQYDSLPLGPIEIPVGKLVPLSYIGQRLFTSKVHIANGKAEYQGNRGVLVVDLDAAKFFCQLDESLKIDQHKP